MNVGKHMLSETRKEIEESYEMNVDYKRLLLNILNGDETMRRKKRQRVHSSSEIDFEYELYIEHLKKQKIHALEDVKEDFPKDIDPEYELLLSKLDVFHSLEREKEDLHEATERENRTDTDLQLDLYIEDLWKHERTYALENEKERVPVYKEKDSSVKHGNLNYRRKLRSYTEPKKDSKQWHHRENHRKRDQKPIFSKRTENPRLMQRKDKDKTKTAENVKCLTGPVTPNPEQGVTKNASKPGCRCLRRGGGGEKSEIEKKHGAIGPNQERHSDDYGFLGRKRTLRSCVNREGGLRLVDGIDNCNKRNKKSESSERMDNISSRKDDNKAKGKVIDNCNKRNKKSESSERMNNISSRKDDNKAKGKVIDDHVGFMHGGVMVKYEKKHKQIIPKKEEDDVEIIDKATFCKMTELSLIQLPCEVNPMEFRFRQEVISILRKPYDEEEHKKLWFDVMQHKPKENHRDLRNGRERSCKTEADGKSYLDYHPDFNRKLERFWGDKPRCLNLLRGFFFWLKNCARRRSFRPWRDSECLETFPDKS